MSANFVAPPQECLHEHLNYFNDNIATGFDDIFTKDFDLLFDPLMMTDPPAADCNGAVGVESHSAPVRVQTVQVHRPQEVEAEPIPYSVPSTNYAAPPQSSQNHQPMLAAVTSNPYYAVAPATVTPPAAPKSVVSQSVIQKASGVATVSPTPVTMVFDSVPKAPAMPKSNPRKRSYSMASEPEPTPVPSTVDTSNLSFQEQEDLRR